MCGITGFVADRVLPEARSTLQRMTRTLERRGPDDEGTYLGESVALGVRRLSVIDLETGHQPMSNEDGTVWAIQNGEIYNFQTLRAQLERRGHGLQANRVVGIVRVDQREVVRWNGQLVLGFQ